MTTVGVGDGVAVRWMFAEVLVDLISTAGILLGLVEGVRR